MWLPHIKADKDGNKTIEIFDQSCSANGCYSLVVKENGKCDIGLMRYHSPSVVKGDLSLDEALEYIQKNLYYRKKPSEY